jgi:hypothetical protein
MSASDPDNDAEPTRVSHQAVVQATLSKDCITVAFDRVACCADSIASSLARLWKSSAKIHQLESPRIVQRKAIG